MTLVQLEPKVTTNIGSIAHNQMPGTIDPSGGRTTISLNVTRDVLSVFHVIEWQEPMLQMNWEPSLQMWYVISCPSL